MLRAFAEKRSNEQLAQARAPPPVSSDEDGHLSRTTLDYKVNLLTSSHKLLRLASLLSVAQKCRQIKKLNPHIRRLPLSRR